MIVTITTNQTIENTVYRENDVVDFPDGGFDPSSLVTSGLISLVVDPLATVITHVDRRPVE